jgi:hypothetical protein
MEPNSPFGQAPNIRPKNWLVESILVTIFCCLPFGIVGIINAASVNTRYDRGDYDGALRASQEAGKWTKIGLWVGVASYIIWLALVFLFGFGALIGMGSH